MGNRRKAGLYSALLKHWRTKRGTSQLDLALSADVSARHLSFLETGRAAPGEEMVVRLARALDVPLRHVNLMLKAAGYEPFYLEPDPERRIPESIADALKLLMEHHEPFPLVVLDRGYRIVDLNRGARALFGAAMEGVSLNEGEEVNLLRLTFDPKGAHAALVNFDEVGRTLLWRLQREVLADPEDGFLSALLEEVLSMPTVSPCWREIDFAIPSSPALVVRLRAGEEELRFLTMVMAFQAPQSVVVDELRIESWFPNDPKTAAICRAWGAA